MKENKLVLGGLFISVIVFGMLVYPRWAKLFIPAPVEKQMERAEKGIENWSPEDWGPYHRKYERKLVGEVDSFPKSLWVEDMLCNYSLTMRSLMGSHIGGYKGFQPAYEEDDRLYNVTAHGMKYLACGDNMLFFQFCNHRFGWNRYKWDVLWVNLTKNLTKDRQSQEIVANWAKPHYIRAFKQKAFKYQAADMFALWKGNMYLEQFDFDKESARLQTSQLGGRRKHRDFVEQDWMRREDRDAHLYAFWYRRIREGLHYGEGITLEDARYWNNYAFQTMMDNIHPKGKKIFDHWCELYKEGKLVSPANKTLSDQYLLENV